MFKRISAFALLSLFAASSLTAADSSFRADITGMVGGKKTRITAVEDDAYIVIRPQNWLKPEDQAFALNAFSRELPREWTDVSFAFEAEDTGSVDVSFKAQWAEENEDRGWVMISDIRINEAPAENGKLTETQNEGKSPKGYRLFNGAKFVADGGKEPGTGALVVNHDATATRRYVVEAGKTYVFTVAFKCVDAPAK